MLLRAKHLIVGLALALVGTDCDRSECDSAKTQVEHIGVERFSVDQVDDETGPFVLFRDGEQVQLLEGARGKPSLEVRAKLHTEAIDVINEAESALGGGQGVGSFDQACLTFTDRPSVQLSLGVVHASLSFGYPWGCPPSGLIEVDTVLRELLNSLPTCSPTPLVTDCEIIDE